MGDVSLSRAESEQVESVLKFIYSGQEVSGVNPMNAVTVKSIDRTGEILEASKLNPFLAVDKDITQDELLKQAQKKATDWYNQTYCREVIKKKFPDLNCDIPGGRQRAKPHDDVRLLAETWIKPSYSLSDIKTSGKTKLPLWSDDYWRIQWGATSYRYAIEGGFEDYQKAVDSYAQPADWKKSVKDFLKISELADVVARWSPAEKYDLTVGDSAFSLTNAQKKEGSRLLGEDGNVEAWMGICHGWAAAAIMVPKPQKQVVARGVQIADRGRVDVTWYPHDVRAISSLAWASGRSASNFVGGRCNVKDPKTYKNGRLIQDECFDNAPSTFHLALGNLIGRAGASLVMDKTFDYQVWNQPIHSYEFTYFNPLDPSKRSRDWKKVAVAYDRKFKSGDRFQKPLTRGECRRAGDCDDSAIKQIVGVIATVVYLAEVTPTPGEVPSEDRLIRETYSYDLELEQEGRKLIATGGEWHYNSHPDFLWVPTKSSLAFTKYDEVEVDVDITKGPSDELTRLANGGGSGASSRSYPLCRVVSELVAASSESEAKSCEITTR